MSGPSPFSVYAQKLQIVEHRKGFAPYHNVIDSCRIMEDVLVQAANGHYFYHFSKTLFFTKSFFVNKKQKDQIGLTSGTV